MMDLFRRYGIYGTINMLISLLRTRIFYRPARLIRFPFEIRNRKYIRIGAGFTTGKYCRLEAYPVKDAQGSCISIGRNVQINDAVHIVGSVGITIGDNVLLASKIFITDLNHGIYNGDGFQDSPLSIPKDRSLNHKPVIIEDNVWIGEFVSVLPGVTIGKGSIIGTMSVVSRDVPPYSIAVGSPAKVVKFFNFETNKWQKIN